MARSVVFWMVMVCALVGAPAALASKGAVDTFGSSGTGAGEFDFPGGVGINQSTGDVYVADVGAGNRIAQFHADGEFVRAWGWGVATGAEAFEICVAECRGGLEGAGAGQFAFRLVDTSFAFSPPQVAVDQTDGSVYVADTGNNRVQKFSQDGAFLTQFGAPGFGEGQFSDPQGVAVDPVSGDVYVSDASISQRVQRFTSSGAFVSQLGTLFGGSGEGQFINPRRVAVDSTGRLYVLDSGNGRIQRFTGDGAFDGFFGAGVVSTPSELAVDAADDHVFIVGSTADLAATRVFEFDAAGAGVDAHGLPAGFRPGGLGVRAATGRIYASELTAARVLILDDVLPPIVTIDAVSDVTATGATFNGAVDPEGPPSTRYRFEYSIDGSAWTPALVTDTPVGEGDEPVAVSQAVTALQPNTEYRVRLVATKDLGAAAATSSEVTFTTEPEAPQVRGLPAGNRSDVAAWLGARVNPRNSATTYYVEYAFASDPGYASGARVPAAPQTGDAGAGGEFVAVSQLATGLAAGAEYRFRVVATNEAGTTVGPDRTFVTRQALPLAPAGRGYELVSPLDKNGGDVDRNLPDTQYSTSGAAAGGDAVAYASRAQFAGIDSGATHGQYRSVRGQTGWRTSGVSPSLEPDPTADLLAPQIWALSGDVSKAVVATNFPLTAAKSLLGGSWGLYLQDYAGPAPTYELLSAPASPLPEGDTIAAGASYRFLFSAATDDMRHVVFESLGRQLTPDGPAPENGPGVYEWVDGQVRFVSELPTGTPSAGAAAGAGNAFARGERYPGDHLISEDGQRIFFMDGVSFPQPLYVRERGVVTRPVSASERGGDDQSVARSARFQAAKADDGSLALFTSSEKLTEDATAASGTCQDEDQIAGCHDDLYLWDATAAEGQRLTDLTVGDPAGGGVIGIAAASDDLSHVYFVAGGVLAEDGVAGRPNLYLWTAGSGIRHLATLDEADGAVWATRRDPNVAKFRDARVGGAGTRLAFVSRARLTAHDNGGHKQVYLYDAVADRLECASCTDLVDASQAEARFFYPSVTPFGATQSPRAPHRLPRNLSEDGRTAFFETAERLVAEDVNGKADVYQWFDGDLSLVSSGTAPGGSEFLDASADGRDVFFTTRERLVGADVDDQVDVYDARVDGGFDEQKPPPPCGGDACQPPAAARPQLPALTAGAAAGNQRAVKRRSFSVRRLTTAQRRALARGRTVRLSVRVNAAGRVSVTARLGRQGKKLFGVARTARRQGTILLPLRLPEQARRRLSEEGRMTVKLSVRFAGVGQALKQSLTLRPAGERSGR